MVLNTIVWGNQSDLTGGTVDALFGTSFSFGFSPTRPNAAALTGGVLQPSAFVARSESGLPILSPAQDLAKIGGPGTSALRATRYRCRLFYIWFAKDPDSCSRGV
jgi:hypothetical protein